MRYAYIAIIIALALCVNYLDAQIAAERKVRDQLAAELRQELAEVRALTEPASIQERTIKWVLRP